MRGFYQKFKELRMISALNFQSVSPFLAMAGSFANEIRVMAWLVRQPAFKRQCLKPEKKHYQGGYSCAVLFVFR